jgi:signal transduction histidine kinase
MPTALGWGAVNGWARLRTGDASDLALAALLLLASLYDLATGRLGGSYPHSAWAHLPFLVLTSVPVAIRHRAPLVALVAMAVFQTLWIDLLYPLDVQPPLIPFVQLVLVVWAAGAYTDRRAARAAVVVVAVGVLSDVPYWIAGKPASYVLGPNVVILVAFGLGLAFAKIRRERQLHEERAARLELERDQAALEAAVAERTRIARELHDVVSHDVSLMVLQASVERRANPDDPSAETLATIESTGREALVELRRMLGVLRREDEVAPLAPQPGLGEVASLVEQAQDAGLPVTLDLATDRDALPAGLGIATYRIVQEALTNSAKHAPGAPVHVRVCVVDDQLDIEVTNDSGASDADMALPSGGRGLVGMRERVALFGGTLDARKQAAGGFRVHARLPLAVG